MLRRNTELIEEGKIKIRVPKLKKEELPEHAPVFYNPEMILNRDISVCVLAAFKKYLKNNSDEIKVCDALSATGIRAIRYSKECNVNSIANDFDKKSVKMIRSNIRLNKARGTRVTNNDANVLLTINQKQFDFVDIDPFGSPVFFYDSSARALRRRGLFAATATDTAALNGVYPETCLRKYGIEPVQTEFSKELGLRIMITSIIKTFARFSLSFIPVISHTTRHYFRVYGITKRSKTGANKTLNSLEHLSVCKKCNTWEWGIIKECKNCKNKATIIEPIYSGKIQDKAFCHLVLEQLASRDYLQKRKEAVHLIHQLAHESESGDFYYNIHKIAKRLGQGELKKMDFYINKLRENGFTAERTHASNHSIKTTASLQDIEKLIL